jgi:Sulfotransferase family
MFIIFGWPRSGTTLLSAALDLHPEVVVPDETDFIVPLALIVDRVKDPAVGRPLLSRLIAATERFPESLGRFLDAEAVSRAVERAPWAAAPILEALYADLAARAGKRLAGDKSPNDLASFGLLLRGGLFDSEIRVLHIVRDLRDVVLSLRTVGWAPRAEATVPRPWATANLGLHLALRDQPHRYHLVRFEELVAAPRPAFEAIARFLGVPFDDALLRHEDRGRRQRDQPHHGNLGRPFLAERAGAWRAGLPEEARRSCETSAAEAMEMFGYM